MSEMVMNKFGYLETPEDVIACYVKMIKEAAEEGDVVEARRLLNSAVASYNDPESNFLVKLCNELEKAFPLKCPKFGTAFTGYKICEFADDINYRFALVELEIPSTAYRSSAFGNKCRCERAIVKSVKPFKISCSTCEMFYNKGKKVAFRSEPGKVAYSIISQLYGNDKVCEYEVGQEVVADAFDTFRWNACSNGIHFFMTEEEALNFVLHNF